MTLNATTMAFLFWFLVGLFFIIFSLICFFSKKEKPFGFWANAKTFPVRDVKAYNRALAKLWFVFGCIFILLGLPLLAGQNSPYIIFTILGVPAETIGAMAVYVTVIEKKYRA